MPEPPAEKRPDDQPPAAAAPSSTPVVPDAPPAAVAPAIAPPPEPAQQPQKIIDVWSRTADKYRIRAALLLIVNFALFCGLCAFTHWLRVGSSFSFSPESYLEPLRFWGPQTHNLYDFILYPISVDQTPIHGVIIGLLMACIVAIPISVSILYRFRSALPFVAATFIFAHMPWMAITLVGSCVLASVPPFRLKFRFGAALVAMLPVLLYLILATRGPGDPASASISPERKLLLAGPWLLAILAACTMMAVIIFIAHVVNYRPGAVAPVMAVMFAAPAFLFLTYVGVDELQYRVLESTYGPRSEHFEPVQDATDTILALLHHWTNPALEREPRRTALLAMWSADPEEQNALKHRVAQRLLLDLMDSRREAYDACKEFIADHPTGQYVACALFIQARALDTRLDERALIGGNARRELYTNFPCVESEPIWTNLLTAYPESPLAVAARRRVAQLRLRKGDVDGALAALALPALNTADQPQPETQPKTRPFLRKRPPESSLEYDPDQDLFEAQGLRELILANRDDPKYGVEPLQSLAALDPHRPGYRNQLLHLIQRYPDSLLHDNLVVRWASAATDRADRAAKLLACIERYPAGDALPEAMFELADLESQALGSGDEARRAAGIARMRELIARFPQSCWARRATERLRIIAPRQTQPTQPAVSP